MTWWRRDPSSWCRSPLRYARLLRDSDTFRTRCFSRSPIAPAKHNDDRGPSDSSSSSSSSTDSKTNDKSRPPGLSNIEWLQLQRYRHWKRKLCEDPYYALFGASNDMLAGKGLKEWDWVYKSFPKWMVREMDFEGLGKERGEKGGDGGEDIARGYGKRNRGGEKEYVGKERWSDDREKKYPRKVEIVDESEGISKREREGLFPEPELRSRRFEGGDWMRGVVSPSDTRRPGEQTVVKNESNIENDVSSRNADFTLDRQGVLRIPRASTMSEGIKQRSTESVTEAGLGHAAAARKEVSSRENSFIEEFLADDVESKSFNATSASEGKAGRQTALDRRSSQGVVPKSRKVDEPAVVPPEEMPLEPVQIPASQADDFSTIELPPPRKVEAKSSEKANTEWLMEGPNTIRDGGPKQTPAAYVRRSASEILEQLPQDDLDFLSASEIRASMGTKKRTTENSGETNKTRKELEKDFETVHKKNWELDSMVESKIMNDQLIRRTTRKLQDVQEAQETPQVDPQKPVEPKPLNEPQLETSTGCMTKWLQTSGDTFAQHFWQDPVQVRESNGLGGAQARSLERIVENITIGMKKSRRAMDQVAQDLSVDIEASKPLLARLKNDEKRLELALKTALRNPEQDFTVKRSDISGKLRKDLDHTHKEFEFASLVLEEIRKLGLKEQPRAFKQRLRHAATILNKNTRLARVLLFRLQACIDSQEMGRTLGLQYSDLAYRLLALQDTQLALLRLIDRAMQVYRVWPDAADDVSEAPKKEEDTAPSPNLGNHSVEPTSSQCILNAAAEKHLENEVLAQKLAMQGLSDDGYSRSPRVSFTKSFEEPNPLAHSLFRPFGMQLDSLGKEVNEMSSEKDAMKKKLADEKLIKEVKSAYEDVYGPITVEHRQLGYEAKQLEEISNEAPSVEEPPVAEVESSPASSSSEVLDAQEESAKVSRESTQEAVPTTAEMQEDDTTTSAPDAVSSAAVPGTSSTLSQCSSEPLPTLESLETEPAITDPPEPTPNLPTHFEILIYDPQKDQISITFTSSPPPRDTSPPVPLHHALATLENPAKFLPHITPGTEIISAKKDMLILRENIDGDKSRPSFETLNVPNSETLDSWEDGRKSINPIDGTTRLSPTGYVGFDELESDFDERRKMADEHSRRLGAEKGGQERNDSERRGKRGGGFASVVKTAIVAGAGCYVVGVMGEVARQEPDFPKDR